MQNGNKFADKQEQQQHLLHPKFMNRNQSNSRVSLAVPEMTTE